MCSGLDSTIVEAAQLTLFRCFFCPDWIETVYRNKEFGNVLAQIPDAVKSHPNYKKSFGQRSETAFRFILKSKLDENRELKTTLLAFDIPK